MTPIPASRPSARSERSRFATKPMPALFGGFIDVPAYVMAEPRKRGGIGKWLSEKRATAVKGRFA